MTHEEINKAIINQLHYKGYNWFYELFEDSPNIDTAEFEFDYKQLIIEVKIKGTVIYKTVYCDTSGEIQELTGIDNLQKDFDNWYTTYSNYIEDYTNMNDTCNTLNEKYR